VSRERGFSWAQSSSQQIVHCAIIGVYVNVNRPLSPRGEGGAKLRPAAGGEGVNAHSPHQFPTSADGPSPTILSSRGEEFSGHAALATSATIFLAASPRSFAGTIGSPEFARMSLPC